MFGLFSIYFPVPQGNPVLRKYCFLVTALRDYCEHSAGHYDGRSDVHFDGRFGVHYFPKPQHWDCISIVSPKTVPHQTHLLCFLPANSLFGHCWVGLCAGDCRLRGLESCLLRVGTRSLGRRFVRSWVGSSLISRLLLFCWSARRGHPV